MRLYTYFRAMEQADAHMRLLADHNVTDTSQYYHAQMRCNRLRDGLIRRMERAELERANLRNDVALLKQWQDEALAAEERAR